MAKRAEQTGGFAKEQFGSRKRHRAIDHAWNKQLTLDMLRQLRIPGVLAPNDLKSCYDRICHAIASLCMRRQGVAESEVVCMFSTLQHLEHTIRCAYGDSKETYGSQLWAILMQGVYQGNGAGPVIWAVVSSPILQIMREAGFGTFFKAAISGEDIRLVGYAFVDETDLIQTAKNPTDSIESVIHEMQKGMDTWEGLISATGGALSVVKGCWWAIDFKWAPDGMWKYKDKDEIEGSLYAIDFDGQRKKVSRLDVHQAFETLGVFLAPNGNSKESIDKLHQKATTWAERLRTAHLKEQETVTALKATILKTLEYPLLTLHLSQEQCTKIMKPVLHAALPKAKFNRNFCRRTLYGPGSHLGVEIHNLFTSQLIEHVDGILRHGPTNSLSGQLLRGSIEAVKVELGLSGDLFSQSFKQYGHLATDCWVTRTWKELEEANIQVIERTPNLPIYRTGDSLIMERFTKVGFKGIALARLNRCRLWLQVSTLSDLCDGSGNYILQGMFIGNNPMKGSSDLSWPNQGDVDATMWRTWKRAIRKAFRCNRAGKLPIPLGKWLPTNDINWRAWHDPLSHRTFVREGASWRQFRHQPRTIAGQDPPVETEPTDSLPPSVVKAVAWVDNHELRYHNSSRHATTNEIDSSSLAASLDNLEKEWKWVIPYVVIPQQGQLLAAAIRDGTALAVADGSFKHERGTSGFCITTADRQHAFYGANDVPGDSSDDHCSYRSELTILGIMVLCRALCDTYNIQSGQMTIGCDNLEAGRHAVEFQDPPRPTDNHFDILQAIYRCRSQSPLSLSYKHVEGHQKEKYPSRRLDAWAKLNDSMDALAKAYWEEIHESPRLQGQPLMPNEWLATMEGRRICKNFKISFRRQFEGRRLEAKWTSPTRRKGITKAAQFQPLQIKQMDFNAIQKAWDGVSGNRRRFVAKLSSSFFPVGSYMKRMKFWPKDNCPCCLGRNETIPHMLLDCPDPRVADHRIQAIETFSQHLRRIRTDSQIYRALMSLTRQALLGQPRQPHDEPDRLKDAIVSQLFIGRHQFLLGRLSKEWSTLQHKAYTHYAPWLSGAAWAKKVVQGIWDLTFSIWDHRNTIYTTRMFMMSYST